MQFHLLVVAQNGQSHGVADWLLLAHAKMEGIMRTSKLLVTLSAAFLLGLVTQDVWAQANNIARIYVLTPKSGMAAEFETALGQHAEWRREHNDPWTWMVHCPGVGLSRWTCSVLLSASAEPPVVDWPPAKSLPR